MNVKNKFKLSSIALASAMAMGAMTAPAVVSAEVSYNAAVRTMNIFRGTNGGVGTVEGGADYNHASGAYAGVWAIDLPATNQYELDLYAGYSGEVAGFGYDISYWDIDVPEIKGQKSTTELVLGLSYDAFSFGYLNGKDPADTKYNYITAGYDIGKFGIMYGMMDPDGKAGDYSHINLSYAATDALSFTVSKATRGSSNTTTGEELLFSVGYSLPIGK